MKRANLTHGKISEHGHGLGVSTPEMVEERAREIAVINGRPPNQFNADDLAQAERELSGRKDNLPPLDEESETIVTTRIGIPGTQGHHTTVVAARDEQTNAEQLVDQGLEEAEHEHMFAGSKESYKRARQ